MQYKNFLCFYLFLLGIPETSFSQATNDPWTKAERVVQSLKTPIIPQRTINIMDYGGFGDGIKDCHAAFERALKVLDKQGGGRILVPKGIYRVQGPIHMIDNLEIHLEEGAVLSFESNFRYYSPPVLTSWEGTLIYNFSPFIYAAVKQNLAITGKGTIDGNGSELWNNWKSIQGPDQQLSRKMNHENWPLEDRIFGEGHFLRPQLMQFNECSSILIEGITITDAPFWCIHLLLSKNITIRNVKFDAQNYNNDGIDPESSENILIEGVIFNNRDDNIAIKSGRDAEGRRIGKPSKNIVIRNCKFKGHNAIAMGSEMSGGIENIFVENCTAHGPVYKGIYLKSNKDRGGYIRDVYIRNVQFTETFRTIDMDTDYKNQGEGFPPLFENIHISNIRAKEATDTGIILSGTEEKKIRNVTVKNVSIEKTPTDIVLKNVYNTHLINIEINGKKINPVFE